MAEKTELATFGAGCFWGVESFFREVKGVSDAICGYAGGHTDNPTYEDICYKNTGHAEVVQVTYDPDVVSFEKLLEVFFANHNPTTLNRQGPDVGDQYRSAVFAHDDTQRAATEAAIEAVNASRRWPSPVVTTIERYTTFFAAEDYHQRYFEKRGIAPTCHI